MSSASRMPEVTFTFGKHFKEVGRAKAYATMTSCDLESVTGNKFT